MSGVSRWVGFGFLRRAANPERGGVCGPRFRVMHGCALFVDDRWG